MISNEAWINLPGSSGTPSSARSIPPLKQLEGKALIHSEIIPQEGKPDRKVYSITEAGRQALHNWLNEPFDETPAIKSPVLLKIFFLESLGKQAALTQMIRQLSAQQLRLKHYRQETRRLLEAQAAASDPALSGVLWELIRQHGELQAQASIRWLEMAIEEMEKRL